MTPRIPNGHRFYPGDRVGAVGEGTASGTVLVVVGALVKVRWDGPEGEQWVQRPNLEKVKSAR